MNLEARIESFSVLGNILLGSLDGDNTEFSRKLKQLIGRQHILNAWFTEDNVKFAVRAIATELTEENLKKWTDSYDALKENTLPSTIGLIFAGNIPLAGFHDFLSVLISGNRVLAKTSSKDSELIPFIGEILSHINPAFGELMEFTTGTMTGFDAIIATGSNNSSRYFEYYFGKYPNIIRKNRNSIAIIEGGETASDLEDLGKDIFTYFGLGCRNVSKIYIPEGYEPTSLVEHWNMYSEVVNHSKYANNYDYNKAIYLVNRQKFLDTGFLLMREESKLASPVSVLHYEYYSSAKNLEQQTALLKDNIQCTAGKNHIPFGNTQMPHLWDYADGVDTLEFLLKKNLAGIL
ncbi:MAG: hypothetical protein ACM3NR_01950 [Methanosarcina sp.]